MSTLRMMAKSHLTVLGIAATIIVGLSAINAAAQAPLTTDEVLFTFTLKSRGPVDALPATLIGR